MTAGSINTTARVLVIEDNQVDVDLLRLAFDHDKAWSYETTVADDGEKAIRLLERQAANPDSNPDFIVLDLNLPRRDGAEVLQMIRTTDSLASIPVAVLSSSPLDVIDHKLTAAGVTADGHFTKPMDLDEFLKLGKSLRLWYERQRQQRLCSAAPSSFLT